MWLRGRVQAIGFLQAGSTWRCRLATRRYKFGTVLNGWFWFWAEVTEAEDEDQDIVEEVKEGEEFPFHSQIQKVHSPNLLKRNV